MTLEQRVRQHHNAIGQMIRVVNNTGSVIGRGFFGRLKWLLFGR